MDFEEEQFMKKLKAIFQIEAHEQLQKITDGLLKIESAANKEASQEIIDAIFREAHNLKGSARAVNHTVIQNICQSLESALSGLKEGTIKPCTDFYNSVYAAVDLIKKYLPFEEVSLKQGEKDQIQAILQKMDSFSGEHPSEVGVDMQHCHEMAEISATEEPEAEIYESTVRVPIQKLNNLLEQIEETLMIKLTAKQRVDELKYLLNTLSQCKLEKKDLEKQIFQINALIGDAENQKAVMVDTSLLQALIDFTSAQMQHCQTDLEMIYELSMRAEHDYRISESIINLLFENTKEVLIQPFGSILESFPRMVRDISKELGKNVTLHIEGKEIEIDKRILEEIKDSLIHLVRNAIDHGIETPEERATLNKPLIGTLSIIARSVSGNSVEISVQDDGAGIDIEKLKAKVTEKYVSLKKELEQIKEDDLSIHLFQPGISTSETITEISGRGIGIGVVREQVEKLKGSLKIESKSHQGTTFLIKLPLTLTTFRGLHVQAGGQEFIIPTYHIKKVKTIPLDVLKTIENQKTILFSEKYIPYAPLSDLLNISKKKSPPVHKDALYPIVIIEASAIQIALGVDEIFNEQEIFVKSLGKQLKRVRYISAATIMEWGKVIPILDPFDLVKL